MTQISGQTNQTLTTQKLIVVSRRDLKPGVQASQSLHSSHQFLFEHPTLSKNWFINSNYLVLLSVENEQQLVDLTLKLSHLNIPFSKFYEPDLNNELTSVSFLSDSVTKRITSGMPLLLKEYNKN